MAKSPLHPTVEEVTQRIQQRSHDSRLAYLKSQEPPPGSRSARSRLGCANLAHGFAAATPDDKSALRELHWPNLGIVTAYNDMLSAHQPYQDYPQVIRAAARQAGATAQVAGGVPAMCDGVTQGRDGMELSLFSRDVIALSTALALSHDMFDGALCLGVCDKIVPGLLMGALSFGHLPTAFVPAGPMPSGISNPEKARVRQAYAEGKVDRAELLEVEARSYHTVGTCTFYGTANSNQLLMDVMGLHLPGAAFVAPGSALRLALTRAVTETVARSGASGGHYRPLARIVDERAIVNAMVGLLATGGSTNHTLHLVAMARAAGIHINWDDFAALSAVVPLIARIYPNGSADVNHFHAAGGTPFVIRELLQAGLMHEEVETIVGHGLAAYTREPWLDNGSLSWRDAPAVSGDTAVLRPVTDPFSADGGLKLLTGNLGRSVIKVSAVKPDRRVIEAPVRVFSNQQQVSAAFEAGELDRDVIVVVRGQGPRANGMPELHRLSPALSSLQAKGRRVALVTDGRMSGASGSIPAAIHLTPEAASDGPIARLLDGDVVRLDSIAGTLDVLVPSEQWQQRQAEAASAALRRQSDDTHGMGRELFALFRQQAAGAEQGGGICFR